MRIFVDELPKDCIDCPCESEYYCNLLNEDVGCCKWGEIHKNCPLLSLADYTKQVRAKSEADKKVLICDYESRITKHQELMSWLEHNNEELKQQLHDLPKKIVEEIRDDMSKRIIEKQIKWGDNIQIGFICNAINECLDTILKKYGGEENGKSNM